MLHKRRVEVFFALTFFLVFSTSIVNGEQLFINELFEANPPIQILEERPIVRVNPEKSIISRITADYESPPESTATPIADLTPRKKVALTFDDGPDRKNTPQILNILKAEDVLATFFVVGNQVDRYPDMLMRIFNEGHLIANHSRTHTDFATLTNEEIITLELDPTSQAVEKITGYYPTIMRPPWGSLRVDSVNFLREQGWHIVRWSLDTFDWDSNRNKPEQIIARIEANHHPNAILLMHCNGPATTRVLPDVIMTLRELGYGFVTVDQL